MEEWGRGGQEVPLANCTRASLRGFLRRGEDMFAIVLLLIVFRVMGLKRVVNVRSARMLLYIF